VLPQLPIAYRAIALAVELKDREIALPGMALSLQPVDLGWFSYKLREMVRRENFEIPT
jgi:hypothetical protein